MKLTSSCAGFHTVEFPPEDGDDLPDKAKGMYVLA